MKKFQHIGWPVELGGQFRLVPFQRLCAHPWVLYVYMDQMLDQPNSKRVFMHPGSLRIHPTINQQLQCKFWVRKCCRSLSYIKELNEAPFRYNWNENFMLFCLLPLPQTLKSSTRTLHFIFLFPSFLGEFALLLCVCLPYAITCLHGISWISWKLIWIDRYSRFLESWGCVLISHCCKTMKLGIWHYSML